VLVAEPPRGDRPRRHLLRGRRRQDPQPAPQKGAGFAFCGQSHFGPDRL